MQRITLQGKAVAHFPEQCAGQYVKLLFTVDGGTEIDVAAMNDGQRPVMRTFTIRDISQQEQTIDIDFVRHVTNDLQCGFAGRWAMNTKVGDTIYIAVHISEHSDQSFRDYPITHFGLNRSLIPRLSDHF